MSNEYEVIIRATVRDAATPLEAALRVRRALQARGRLELLVDQKNAGHAAGTMRRPHEIALDPGLPPLLEQPR